MTSTQNNDVIGAMIADQQWRRSAAGRQAAGMAMTRQQFEQHQADQRAAAEHERDHRYDGQWSHPAPEPEAPAVAVDHEESVQNYFSRFQQLQGADTPPADARASVAEVLFESERRRSPEGRAERREQANRIAAEVNAARDAAHNQAVRDLRQSAMINPFDQVQQ